MGISEYETFDVKTSHPILVRVFPTCANAGCLKPCEPKSRQCRDCVEEAKRIEMRIAVDPKPIASFVFLLAMLAASFASAIDYPIVYVRSPVLTTRPRINDIEKPVICEAGSVLMLRRPDGTEEVLYNPGPAGGVLDPAVSLDGKWVFVSAQADARSTDNFGVMSPSNIYKINVATKAVTQLTFGESTRVSSSISGYTTAHSSHNVGACPIPGGKLVFESSRNRQKSVRDGTTRFFNEPLLQLFVMDDDGKNVEQVGFLNLGGSRHPTLLRDGRIMWASGEFHGLRTSKAWGLWASEPDGRHWEPLWSAMDSATTLTSLHWQSQTPNGNIQLLDYYPIQQQGYGNLFDFPQPSVFGPNLPAENPPLRDKSFPTGGMKFSLQPVGAKSLTPWASSQDVGGDKVSHPSPAPDGLLVSLAFTSTDATGLGGTMRVRRAGIYLMPYADTLFPADQSTKGLPVTASAASLIPVVDKPEYYETQPRALVPSEQIYGVVPPERPWLPNPTSTPFGFVGTSGVYARESTHQPFAVSGSIWGQGGDVGDYVNSDIDKIRIVVQRPTPKDDLELYPLASKTWIVTRIERMAVLGEIPVHKRDASGALIRDSAGDPDTSFLAKIPADHSWTFQLLDKHGQVLTHAMTWHQVRPGETRTDCRGCHAHHNPGIQFAGTEASKPGFAFADFSATKPTTSEWVKDVLPILTARCGECHSGATPAAGLNLLDPLVRDSKWVLPFRARLSLLMQRVLSADPLIRMPKDHDPLTPAEIKTLATWIDLGSPRDMGGYAVDHQRPVLYVGSPQRNQHDVSSITFGAYELDGTIASISVKSSFAMAGQPAGAELISLFPPPANAIWTLPIAERPTNGTVTVVVTDNSGRAAKIERTFTADGGLSPEERAIIQAQIDAMVAQVNVLTAEIACLNVQVGAKLNQIVILQNQINLLQAQLQ